MEEGVISCPYVVKRYINEEYVAEAEMRMHKIENTTVLETIGNTVAKNNVRYNETAGWGPRFFKVVKLNG